MGRKQVCLRLQHFAQESRDRAKRGHCKQWSKQLQLYFRSPYLLQGAWCQGMQGYKSQGKFQYILENPMKLYNTRHVTSIIHLARSSPPVAITILKFWDFEKWGRTNIETYLRNDGITGRTTCVKKVITTGRDSGLAS